LSILDLLLAPDLHGWPSALRVHDSVSAQAARIGFLTTQLRSAALMSAHLSGLSARVSSACFRRAPPRLALSYALASRKMSTATTKHKFVVWAPDMTDPDAFQRRLSVRTKHLERADGLRESEALKIGGALLTPESIASPTAEKKMIGSMMIFESESLESLKKLIEEDIYYTGNVWDKEKLVILPFLTAHM